MHDLITGSRWISAVPLEPANHPLAPRSLAALCQSGYEMPMQHSSMQR